MRKKKKTFRKLGIFLAIFIVILINLFALRLYFLSFNMNEALRFMPDRSNFSYEPIIEAHILDQGTKENQTYMLLKDQIRNYGDLIYLTHLYTNHLWAEWGGIELPDEKDRLFLVLRYIFQELKEEQPVIVEDEKINLAFFKAVDEGLLFALSDLHEDHLMAHRIFHDLDYWKFNNHLGVTIKNTNYFEVLKEIPNGSLEGEKKRKALYRGVSEPRY